MAKDMQQARLSAKLGKADEAQALFEIVCDAGINASPPDVNTGYVRMLFVYVRVFAEKNCV